MKINIGLQETDRKALSNQLNHLLADTYTLYLTTHSFHWNVTGPFFDSLHLMFERQYTELGEAVDQIAERIRSLGERAPGSYTEFTKLSAIKEVTGVPSWRQMIQTLLEANETVIRTARAGFSAAAKASDEATADLLTQRLQVHEKAAWMLRSLLQE